MAMAYTWDPGEQIFFLNDKKTPFDALPLDEQQKIRNGFSGFFRFQIMPFLDLSKASLLYTFRSDCRPGKTFVYAFAARLYCRYLSISEAYFAEHVHTDISMQYALGLEGEKIPFSKNSFSRFDAELDKFAKETGRDLLDEVYHDFDIKLAQVMGLDKGFSATYDMGLRIDTFLMEFHGATMPRIQIAYTCNFLVVKLFVSLGISEYLPLRCGHYFVDGDHNKTLYYKGKLSEVAAINFAETGVASTEVKGASNADTEDGKSEKEKRLVFIGASRLQQLLSESIALEEAAQEVAGLLPEGVLKNGCSSFTEIEEIANLSRMIQDQTKLDENGKRIPRSNTEIEGSSLQNPYDPNGTYRHKGDQRSHGYTALVGEAYNKDGDGIIVVRELEPNTVSDQELMRHLYGTMSPEGPSIAMSVDAAFTSPELDALGAAKNVTVFCGGVIGKVADPLFADFKLSDDKKAVISCPQGQAPAEPCAFNDSTRKIKCKFEEGACSACPNAATCAARILKDGTATVYVTESQVFSAQRVKDMGSDTYHAMVNKRNAVEGIPSVMRRKYRIDEVRSFGINRARRYLYSAVSAYNVGKYYAFWSRKAAQEELDRAA